MNIKMPPGVKSPTVIIVGQGTMSGSEKSNQFHEKRMDALEKRMDERYKKFTDNKNYVKEIASLQKSFVGSLNKMLVENKENISAQNNKLAQALKKTLGDKTKEIKVNVKSPQVAGLKSFADKLSSLEEAISKISLKPKTVNYTGKLDSSFNKLLAKMQKILEESKPKMYPSPS